MNSIKLKRGLESARTSITPNEGELIYTTDEKKLYVGDGLTVGGNLVIPNDAELMAAIKNVDGTGSGLDADLLDGIGGSGYLRTDVVNQVGSGNHEFYSIDNSGSFSTSSIELREANLVANTQSAAAYAPALSFHWGAVTQIQLALESDGALRLRDGTTHSVLRAFACGDLASSGVVDNLTTRERYEPITTSNIDVSSASVFSKTITGTTTFTVSNISPTNKTSTFLLELTNGGAFTVNWFSGVKWDSGAAPTLTVAGLDILGFYTRDGGVNWYGTVISVGAA